MQTSQTSVIEGPAGGDQGFRLSWQQRRLWLHAPAENDGGRLAAVPNAQCMLHLDGYLDALRLRQAMQEIISRHDILRTTFYRPAGRSLPVQVVAQRGGAEWREVDLRLCAPEQRAARVEACRLDDLREPFAFAEGPLLRASLLALAASEHVLILTLPALCADTATLQNLAAELRCTYGRDNCGEGPGDAIQYVQLSEWLQSLQEGEEAELGRSHWRAQRVSPPLVFPLQRASRGPSVFIPASCAVPIAPRIAGRLRSLEREDVFLLGCWLTLLWRISGLSFVRIGITCQGRTYEELKTAIGPLARIVPVGCTLREGMRFRELLASLTETVDAAGDWQEYYERSDDEGPYEAAGFELSEWQPEEPVAGLRFDLAFQQCCSDPFHIKFSCTGVGDDLSARLDYDPQVLPAEYVERLAAQLCTLLDAALKEPESRIEELPLLGDDERRFVVEECNDTKAAYPREACLHQLFAEQAARTPHRVAITFEGASLTYDELDRRANKLAHRLRDLKVGPEVRVGIFMHRSLEMMIGLLGVLKAGGAYVPLEPAYPAERLAFMLADSQVPVLLTQRRLRQRLPAIAGAVVLCLDDPFEDIAGGQPEYEPRSGVCAENLVYTLYTSGSTGQPKGALITHRSLVNYLSWCCPAYAVESGEGTVVHSSIGFDATITGLFPPLLVGRSVVLLREAEGVDGLPEAIERGEGFSLIKITPAHLSLLNEVVADGELASKTRLLVIGGDALSGARLASWRRHAPQTRLINEYGPTETVVGCCVHEVSDADLADETVPIGRPIANARLYVLDPRLSPLPTGVPGELFIGGDGVSRGYLGRPALTAERFLPDHLSSVPGGRLYRTGDLTVRRPDGVLSFSGRMDHQVKIRSYRVELGEIEAHLEQHAAVTQSVVIAHAGSSGEKSLVAYVQSKGAKAPTADELRSFLLAKLPEHMVPAVFVILDALPLTAHGKVDRSALPAPETARAAGGGLYVAPRTPTEETLTAIWRDVLKVEQIGIHDDFFRSGGDSILSILVVARAAKAGLRFTTRDLFQHPTIAELASRTAASAAAERGAVDGTAPLTPIQHWFFQRDLPEPHHFNQAVLLDVLPELQIDLLRRAVEQLVAHHDALRLRFTPEATGWRQTHAAAEGTALVSEIDLIGLSAADQQATLEERAGEAQSGLNLSHGPLLRAVLFRLRGGAPGRLLLVIHHLVVDGVSWRILLEDLATACQQLARDEPVKLQARTTAFKDWAIRLREYSDSAALAPEAGYWLERPAVADCLPVDLPSGADANTVASSARVRIALDREKTSALLHEVSNVHRTGVDEVLLTALVQAFARWTGSRSLLIDLEGHGREELFADLDVSRTVGWFTSIFPVHLVLDSNGRDEEPKAIEELKAIQDQLRHVPQRGIGYGLLRYLSSDARLRERLATLPRAQVSFNYLGRIDGLVSEPILGIASEAAGAEEGPGARRPYLLDVIAQVAGGCLQLELVYSTAMHRRKTVENLAGDILACLESLLAHCLSPGARGFMPSDFPEADLSQEELDRLVADLE
jgi:amino acid adenylation domain-containing protein/non-ribosomal peptide synthase protein (TIGR01720 family)